MLGVQIRRRSTASAAGMARQWCSKAAIALGDQRHFDDVASQPFATQQNAAMAGVLTGIDGLCQFVQGLFDKSGLCGVQGVTPVSDCTDRDNNG